MKIITEVEAVQWLGEGHPLPEGAHLCRPEVHWSAGRKYIYFTYPDLRCDHWLGTEKKPLPAPENLGFATSGIKVEKKDGTAYWREVLPFAFWSVKSESSVQRDHRAVYLDTADETLMDLFKDYCFLESWGEVKDGVRCLPPAAEYRVTDGSYGRGFRPVYLKAGDWLILDKDPKKIRAISDAELQKMRA